jgi:hypothetical protein
MVCRALLQVRQAGNCRRLFLGRRTFESLGDGKYQASWLLRDIWDTHQKEESQSQIMSGKTKTWDTVRSSRKTICQHATHGSGSESRRGIRKCIYQIKLERDTVVAAWSRGIHEHILTKRCLQGCHESEPEYSSPNHRNDPMDLRLCRPSVDTNQWL